MKKSRKTTRGSRAGTNRRTLDWKDAYLAALRISGKKVGAAKAAEIDTHTVWERTKTEPEFKAAEEDAVKEAARGLADEARRRAVEGCIRYKFHPKTGEVYEELEYSDSLLTLLLKAHLPEIYKDKIEHQVSGHLTIDELKQRLAEAKA